MSMAKDRIEIGLEEPQSFRLKMGGFVGKVVDAIKRRTASERQPKRLGNPWLEREGEELLREIGRRAPHNHSALR